MSDDADTPDGLDRLESFVDRQAAAIGALREDVAEVDGGGPVVDDESRTSVTRRTALKAGGLAGLLALGSGVASADPQGQVGTRTDPLRALYTDELNGGVAGGRAVTDLVGDGLTNDAGSLAVTTTGKWVDSDTDGLLEPSASHTGIEVSDVRGDTLTDAGSGSVSMGNTLDVAGNDVTSSSGNITLDPSDHVVLSSNVTVEGTTDATKVGLSAYRDGSNQDIESASWETIVFDATDRDDFGGYDTSTGVYQVTHPNGGDYHVTANAEWVSRLEGQSSHHVRIRVNGVTVARRIREVAGPSSESSYVHEHISKTLFGLSYDDDIDIQVYQDSGSSQSIGLGEPDTYLTTHKVG